MTDATVGQLFALASAVSFACSNIFISKGASKSGDKGVVFSVLITMIISSIVWLTVEGGRIPISADLPWFEGVAWFVVAGIMAMVLGRTFLYTSIQAVGVIRASAIKRLNPFFSAILAFFILGETVSSLGAVGMVMIAVAFGLLIISTLQQSKLFAITGQHSPSPKDYIWGVASSLSYAFAYIARKFGLLIITAPAFGTFIGAATGLICFAVMALFIPRYKNSIKNILKNQNIWIVAAGFTVSIGQMLLFAALLYERVSIVVMIASLEVFMSSFLAVVIFRTERAPDAITVLAGAIAMSSVALLTLA